MVGMLIIILNFLSPIARLAKEFLFGPVNVFSVVFKRHDPLKNDNGRTNILILGIGGNGHDGPNLTDAMMVLSLKSVLTGQEGRNLPPVVLISVPRDVYLDSLQNKINFAYQTGLDNHVGATLAKAVVSQITGLPIHYSVVADFSAFAKVIDILGGLDVNVAHVLDDPGYPVSGKENDTCGFSPDDVASRSATITISPMSEIEAFPCRYEQLHFEVGLQHMNGITALKFVRSRHAQSDEGTDFARNQRQQLVLQAVKNKVISTATLTDPGKILAVYQNLQSHINTDLDSSEINNLIKLALSYRSSAIRSTVIDEKFFTNPPIDFRGWILVPNDPSWGEIHEFVKKQLAS